MKEITKEWIQKAEEDYRVAVRESTAKPFPAYAVCFHSQQCVEKYMKALLQENNIYFGKTHDLEILLKNCQKFIPKLNTFREELIWLTTSAVEIRYPSFKATREEALRAFSFMKKIRKLFRDYFNKSKLQTH